MRRPEDPFAPHTRCRGCGEPQRRLADWRCACGGIYGLHGLRFSRDEVDRDRDDISRYRAFIPIPEDSVTLGAGWTPVTRIELFGDHLTIKEEYLNPTGSFKDRGVVMLANLARGTDGAVFVDSVGNTGLALATFAEALDLEAHVFAPIKTSREREDAITERGARFHRVAGPRSECGKVAVATAKSGACFLSHIFQPLFQAGTASTAFELFEQMTPIPERIFLAVGQGSLLLGLTHGFRALATAGEISTIPAITAARPSKPGGTVAVGASAAYPVRAQEVRSAATATGGHVVQITEDELYDSVEALDAAGIMVDPTCALGIAAWRKTVEADGPANDLVILTGARREPVPPRHSGEPA